MEELDTMMKEPNGAGREVFVDPEPELMRQDWKYKKGVIGIRTIIEIYLFFTV